MIQIHSFSPRAPIHPTDLPSERPVPRKLDILSIENSLAKLTKPRPSAAPVQSRQIAETLRLFRMAQPTLAPENTTVLYGLRSGTSFQGAKWFGTTLIAEGAESKVFESMANPEQVLKIFKDQIDQCEIYAEVEAMNLYHGRGFASLSPDGRRILMKKLDGIALHLLKQHQKPLDLSDKILSCIETIISRGIYPADLCEANFLYCEATGKIHPVDLKSAVLNDSNKNTWKEAFQGGLQNLIGI
jgi:hypothetical protein